MYDLDNTYKLSSIIVHIGSSVDQGHYIAIVKIGLEWVLFDDDKSETIPESKLSDYFGSESTNTCGYIFFYEVQ